MVIYYLMINKHLPQNNKKKVMQNNFNQIILNHKLFIVNRVPQRWNRSIIWFCTTRLKYSGVYRGSNLLMYFFWTTLNQLTIDSLNVRRLLSLELSLSRKILTSDFNQIAKRIWICALKEEEWILTRNWRMK